MRVNLIVGVFNDGARGIERARAGLQSASGEGEEPRFRIVGVRGPRSGPLSLPVLYTALPARVACVAWRHPHAVNHIVGQSHAHLLNLLPLPRSLVTCHDLIELSQLEQGLRHWKPHRRAHIRGYVRGLLRAHRIMTDSEHVREQLIARLGCSPAKVRTVYPGLDLSRFRPLPADENVLRQYGIPPDEPFVLYVGSEQPRKNLSSLARAVALARRTCPALRLIKVGHHQTSEGRHELLRLVESCDLAQAVTIVDEVPDEHLPHLYAAASVFVFPSLMEGFGYPPVEAMACGTPVISSRASCLPEVLGDAALLVDPLRPEEIAEAIAQVLRDASLRRSLVARGLERAQRYDARMAAQQVRAIYKELCEQ